MRWSAGNRRNIEDLRGRSGFAARRMAPVGIGGILLLMVLGWATGTDFLSLLSPGGSVGYEEYGSAPPAPSSPEEERDVDFVDADPGRAVSRRD